MHFIRRITILATALAIAALAVGIGPASADSVCTSPLNKPDGKIRVESSGWLGAGEYGLTSLGLDGLQPGQKATFRLKWKNTTSTPREIRLVKLASEIGAGMRVRFYLGGQNVTEIFSGSAAFFNGIPPNKSVPIDVLVKNRGVGPSPVRLVMSGSYSDLPATVCDALEVAVNQP